MAEENGEKSPVAIDPNWYVRPVVPVKIKRLDKDLPLPKYMTSGAAGMDIMAAEDFSLLPGQFKLIRTGIAIELPYGYEAQIRPRSGLATKYGVSIINCIGTVDSDYRGEIMVGLVNHNTWNGGATFEAKKGERIAQMVIAEVPYGALIEVDELSETDRGEGGFGSTGK